MYTADFYVYATLPIDFASYYATRYIAGRPDFEIKKNHHKRTSVPKVTTYIIFYSDRNQYNIQHTYT